MLYALERLTGTPLGPPKIGGGAGGVAFSQGVIPRPADLATNSLALPDIPPLTCRLYRGEAGVRKVVVTDGCVIEVLQAVGDSPKEHPIGLTRDTTYHNLYREHLISAAEPIVGVAFHVDADGKINDTPTIAVRSVAAAESTHYIPAVGPDAGTVGDCFYALAKLAGSGDDDYLEVLHAGSNIDYVPDLSTFKRVAGAIGKDIFTSFNQTLGRYEYRGLIQDEDSPFEVDYDTAGTDLLIKWTNAKNLDLVVKSVELVEATESAEITIPILNVTGTTGVEVDEEIEPDGEHQHNFNDVQSGGSSFGTSGLTGLDATISTVPEPDGAHLHNVIATTAEATTSVTIKTYSIQLASPIYVVVFRNGLYHSVVASEAAAAAIPHTGTKEVKTIHQFNL